MADSDKFNMRETCRTAIGVQNHMAAILHGSTYTPNLAYSINSLYSVHQTESPAYVPTIGWFGIGINGHFNIDDMNKTVARPVSPENMNLYTPIPFVCVPLDEDSEEYRIKYRMRRVQALNGIMHVQYYLKSIQLIDSSVRIVRIDPSTNKEIDYELNPSNLTPTPPTPQTTGTISGALSEIQVSQRFLMPISGSEVVNPVSTMYNGDITMARLSEYGLFTGEERVVTGYDSKNTAFQYKEIICAQLSYHTTTSGMDASDPSSVLDKEITMSGGNMLTMS